MIARTWRGWTRREDADVYLEYLRETYPDDDRYLVERELTVRHYRLDE